MIRRRTAAAFEGPRAAGSGWSPRDWLLPWMQIALCLGAALPEAPSALAAGVVAVLVRVALAAGPAPYLRRWGWIVLLGCGLWWMREALAQPPGSGALPLFRIAGWCLVLLACVQILSVGRGGSRVLVAWNALGATWILAGSGGGWAGSLALVGQGLLSIESLRASDGRSWRRASIWGRWLAVLALAAALAAVQRAWRPSLGVGGRSAWSEPNSRIKGFSVVARLGTFGASYRPDREREVAVRVWTIRPPRLLKGMVHDLYAGGSWVVAHRASFKSSERMSLDFSQFCRERSDGRPPIAWATSPDDHLPVLFAPGGTGCVGVVADSLRVAETGVFRSPADGAARGWTWYGPDGADTLVLPSDLRVPRELEALLDSVWAEIDATGGGGSGSASAPEARIAAWFDETFRYDLDIPLEAGVDPLRTFLRTRRGYCEYFASLSALLLRRAGVPARYATGLSDPEPGADGRSWIYRQGGAHAWVEWRGPDGTWREFDPTPPARTPRRQAGFVERMTESVRGWSAFALHVARDGAWRDELERWQQALDAIPERAGQVSAAVAFLALAAWRWRASRKRRPAAAGWAGVLARGESVLRRQGHARRPDETVGDFLARLPESADARACRSLERYQTERWKRPEGVNQ